MAASSAKTTASHRALARPAPCIGVARSLQRLRQPLRAPAAFGTDFPYGPVLDLGSGDQVAYVALGLAAASFAGTFFVAPLFRSSFKEEVTWNVAYESLVASGGVKSISAAEAFAKRKSAVLLDVRLAAKYEAGHAQGAVSAPIYLPIQNWDLASNIRRAGFAAFGVYGTELNTRFLDDVAAVVPRGREVILLCENGGSLTNKAGTKFGFQSRSLKAAYYLRQASYKVAYVEGGMAQWQQQQLPVEGGEGGGSTAAAAPAPAPAAVGARSRR